MTLFLDKERENLCWCPPGAAELVPDERYRLSARSLAEVRDTRDFRAGLCRRVVNLGLPGVDEIRLIGLIFWMLVCVSPMTKL